MEFLNASIQIELDYSCMIADIAGISYITDISHFVKLPLFIDCFFIT